MTGKEDGKVTPEEAEAKAADGVAEPQHADEYSVEQGEAERQAVAPDYKPTP
jgi:hypothetical protein